jgi:hypothetical protein
MRSKRFEWDSKKEKKLIEIMKNFQTSKLKNGKNPFRSKGWIWCRIGYFRCLKQMEFNHQNFRKTKHILEAFGAGSVDSEVLAEFNDSSLSRNLNTNNFEDLMFILESKMAKGKNSMNPAGVLSSPLVVGKNRFKANKKVTIEEE